MKFTLIAVMAALLAGGCGRYEGPEPAFHSGLEIADDHESAPIEEKPEKRTLRVILRDLGPLVELYDENCRAFAPPGLVDTENVRFYPELQIVPGPDFPEPTSDVGPTGDYYEPGVSGFDIPLYAQKADDGCEAPGMVVEVPFSETYTMRVAQEGQGTYDPATTIWYPNTFHVPYAEGVTSTLVLVK